MRAKIFLFFVLLTSLQFSQNSALDSLKALLKTTIHDTTRCNILNKLSVTAPDNEWPKFNMNLKALCEQHLKGVDIDMEQHTVTERFYLNHLASALNNEGYFADQHGETQKTLELYKKSLKIREGLKEKSAIANSLSNLGNVYQNLGDIPKALEYLHKAMKLQEEVKHKRGQSYSLNNLASIYGDLGDKTKALEYYEKAFKIQTEINEKLGAAYSLSNIGYYYNKYGEVDKALEYYSRSLKLKEEIDDKHGIAYSYNNIGIIYKEKGDNKTALEYYNKSLKIREELGEKNGIGAVPNQIAEIKLKMGEIKEAKKLGEQSLKIAKEIGFPDELKEISRNLSEIYLKDGNYKDAYEMQVLFKQMSDSVNSVSAKKASIQKSFQYDYDKKVAADSVMVAEERKVVHAQLEEERTKRFALYGGLALVIVFSIFMVNRFMVTNKQKKIIENKEREALLQNIIIHEQKQIVEEKQKEVLDSIHYAKRIQTALIANSKFIDENLPGNFVYFNPKDIVSGDFYWATVYNNKFYLAICDSTGHGVPGAFMSLLNMGFLSEAIKEKNIEKPNEIFDYVRERLINSISAEGQKDGMDGVLLCYDKKKNTYEYAAANNEPILIRDGNIIELQKDKMPVGKGERSDKFTLHQLEVQKGDVLYLYTDGYADQFGGPKGKKFKYKQLNELLLTLIELPPDQQRSVLENTFQTWKGSLEQVDDVLIAGIKI